jgi:hypothetical protein
VGGVGLHVSSQPWVTAKTRAASRKAKVLSKRNTRESLLPLPCERWTEKEARKRPQSVWCVAGETTYLPMEMAMFEILINQGECRLEFDLREHRVARLAAAQQTKRATKVAIRNQDHAGLPPLKRRRDNCARVLYITK